MGRKCVKSLDTEKAIVSPYQNRTCPSPKMGKIERRSGEAKLRKEKKNRKKKTALKQDPKGWRGRNEVELRGA